MKKIMVLGLIAFLLGIGIAGTFWGTSIAEAASGVWNSCPRGEVNCQYPGKCRSYIDTNQDSICDRSQSAPTQVASTPSQASAAGTTVVSGTTGTAAAAVSSSPTSDVSSSPTAASLNTVAGGEISEFNTLTVETKTSVSKRSYYFLPILLALGLLYSLTWILSHKRILSSVFHRRIWNLVLLVSTMISALLGLFLIMRIDFNINLTLPFNMLFWHVEAGIALGIVAVFHILWHWRYFAKMLKAGSPVEKTARLQSSTVELVESQLKMSNRK
jgi:hypothetical protein